MAVVLRPVVSPATVEVLRHVYKVRRKLLMLCEDKVDAPDVTVAGEPDKSEVRARLVALPNSVVRAHESDQSSSEVDDSDVSPKSVVASPKSASSSDQDLLLFM